MKFIKLPLKGAFIMETEGFSDHRGIFSRLFCQKEIESIHHRKEIVQINHSINYKAGALRGMHFQKYPMPEIKIIKCLRGSVFDVVVDLRAGSPTLLQWYGVNLSAENNQMLYIPEGLAHGFQTLIEGSELLYLHSEYYSPQNEGAIRYDDPLVNIKWPKPVTDISERDLKHPLLNDKFEGYKF